MQNTNPYCKSIDKINFSNLNELYDILYQDKHTRIEGLCSEAIFMEDIVQDNLHPITTGFWFSRIANNQATFHVRKMITDTSVPLNMLDYKIMDGFASIKDTPVSVVYFDERSKNFQEFMHVKGRLYDRIEGMGTAIYPKNNSLVAKENERNRERIEKAGDFLHQRGLLKNAVISRLFANCYLGGAVWDIDAFTLSLSGQVIALEVKQKFPIDDKAFGLNDSQEKLFRFLVKNGMPVIHIILQKPEKDLSIHAIDLLTMPEYTERTNWIFTRYFPEKLKSVALRAPKHTSIHGQSDVLYRRILIDQFAFLKKLGATSDDVRSKLLEGLE